MSLFSGLFKSSKTPTFNGTRPYEHLTDAAGGSQYLKQISDRANGIGVGYSPDYVEKSTNPVIGRMRNQFSSYDLPELKSELTATGRRAGSSGFQQISKAYENQGLNEEAAYAPIYQQAQEASRQDTNSGLQSLGQYNLNDANLKDTYANFDKNTFNDAVQSRQYDQKMNNQNATNAINYGTSLYNSTMGGGGVGGSAGLPTYGSNGSGNSGGNYNLSPADQQIMSRLISRMQSGRV